LEMEQEVLHSTWMMSFMETVYVYVRLLALAKTVVKDIYLYNPVYKTLSNIFTY
jgi:hypothetical protein